MWFREVESALASVALSIEIVDEYSAKHRLSMFAEEIGEGGQ